MSKNKWKFIPDGKIIIDFSTCKYVDEIHEKLKESFGFPDYYGRNWSAFWDCLSDFGISEEEDREVIVCGLNLLPTDLKDYTRKMIEIMRRAEKEYPQLHFAFKESKHE